MHPLIKAELDNLAIRFPGQSQINLDEYAELYGIKRQGASRHLRRRKIPVTKEGRGLYISMIDLATYKAQTKSGVASPKLIGPRDLKEEMKQRRGFSQQANQRQLNGTR